MYLAIDSTTLNVAQGVNADIKWISQDGFLSSGNFTRFTFLSRKKPREVNTLHWCSCVTPAIRSQNVTPLENWAEVSRCINQNVRRTVSSSSVGIDNNRSQRTIIFSIDTGHESKNKNKLRKGYDNGKYAINELFS